MLVAEAAAGGHKHSVAMSPGLAAMRPPPCCVPEVSFPATACHGGKALTPSGHSCEVWEFTLLLNG